MVTPWGFIYRVKSLSSLGGLYHSLWGKKVYLPSSLAGANSGKMQLQTVKVSVKCLCYYVQFT